MKWVPAITVKLPYPVSANRYWRTRIIPAAPSDGRYTFKELLLAAASGKVNMARLTATLARIPEGFVSTYVSKEAAQYKESVGWLLKNAGVRQALTGRVRIDLQLHPHCPQDWRLRMKRDPLYWADTVQRLDLDNARKVVYDALKGIAIGDDVQVWKDTGEVMEPKEGVDAHVVVRISRGVLDNPQGALDLPEPQQLATSAEEPDPFAFH